MGEASLDSTHIRTPLSQYRVFPLYFHSMMTQNYRLKQVEALKSDDIWGIFCTDHDACGMVS